MLTRYEVLASFELDGDVFLQGSTFINDDELTGELLRKAGFLQQKPKSMVIAEVNEKIKRVYLSEMNKTELIKTAEKENIQIDETQTKRVILAQIRRARALRGEDTI